MFELIGKPKVAWAAIATSLVWSGGAVGEEISFLAAEYSAASLPFWQRHVAAFEAAHPD